MSTAHAAPSHRFFAGRLVGTTLLDPLGESVGKLRDLVIVPRRQEPARIIGLVVEVAQRRRVFLPITRVTAFDVGKIVTNGVINLRRFEKRTSELLVLGDLLERTVVLTDGSGEAVVEDVGAELQGDDWVLARLFVRRRTSGGLPKLVKRGQTLTVPWHDVTGLYGSQAEQSAALLMASYDDLKPADLADVFEEIEHKRRVELAAELPDERLADVIPELTEDVRIELLTALDTDRAADILDEMDPDDAADVMQELPLSVADELLARMEPEEAEDVRRLLAYDEYTAGGMMTTEPLIATPETPVAHALAMIRSEELTNATAAAVYVCRQPLETPTGRMLGTVNFQHLLRERPDTAIGDIMDSDRITVRPTATLAEVTRAMATYNLLTLGVCDEAGHLHGAVTVDDVLDHLLPDDWREQDEHEPDTSTGTIDLSATREG